MASKRFGKNVRWALWFSPIVVVPIAFFASLPWLQQLDKALALGIATATAIFVMGYSLVLSRRVSRGLDEVEIAGQRFAQTKGMMIGTFAAPLVMMFPPAMNGLVELATRIGAGSAEKAATLGITIGFILVVVLQLLGMIAVSIWWARRVVGPQA